MFWRSKPTMQSATVKQCRITFIGRITSQYREFWNVPNILAVRSTSRPIPNPTSWKSVCKIRRKITVSFRIRSLQLLRKKYLRGYRDYGQTNAAQQRQDGKACFRVCSIVLIAARSSISAQRTAFLQSRNTMFALITRAIRELVPHISSEKKP